jgi:hypothetical protein
MMARPIHHFLKEFASGEVSPPFQPPLKAPPAPPKAKPKPEPEAVAAPAPAVDTLAIRLEESYQQGVTAGRAIASEATEAQAAELAVDFDRRIEEVRNTFSTALADSLAVELRAGIEAASTRISSHVATALIPFLREGLARAAITDFVKELSDMIDTAEGLSVEVTCPQEIAEPLRERLAEAMAARGAPPGCVRCIPGKSTDISVTLNETVIQTRLAEWLTRLEGVLR